MRLGELWLPASARVEDLQSSVTSVISQEYWPLASRPRADLYDTSVDDEPLLERLVNALAEEGISVEPGTVQGRQ